MVPRTVLTIGINTMKRELLDKARANHARLLKVLFGATDQPAQPQKATTQPIEQPAQPEKAAAPKKAKPKR
jgi:hypothetical protein